MIAILLVVTSCSKNTFVPVHDTINLNGSWKFALDTAGVGVNEKWYNKCFLRFCEFTGNTR